MTVRTPISCAFAVVLLMEGCGGKEDQPPINEVQAVPSYTTSPGAPVFCSQLADATALPQLAEALNVRAIRPSDEAAVEGIRASVAELRAVLDAVTLNGQYQDMQASVRMLVTALIAAADSPVTAESLAAISDSLDALGQQAQPVCEFPG